MASRIPGMPDFLMRGPMGFVRASPVLARIVGEGTMPARQAMAKFADYLRKQGAQDAAVLALFPKGVPTGYAATLPMFAIHLTLVDLVAEAKPPFRKPSAELAIALGEDVRPLEVLVEELCGMDLEEMRDDDLADVPQGSPLGKRLQALDIDSNALVDEVRKIILEFSAEAKKPKARKKPAAEVALEDLDLREPSAQETDERVVAMTALLRRGFAEVGAENPERSAERLKARPLRIFLQVVRELIQALERKAARPLNNAEKDRLTRLVGDLRLGHDALRER